MTPSADILFTPDQRRHINGIVLSDTGNDAGVGMGSADIMRATDVEILERLFDYNGIHGHVMTWPFWSSPPSLLDPLSKALMAPRVIPVVAAMDQASGGMIDLMLSKVSEPFCVLMRSALQSAREGYQRDSSNQMGFTEAERTLAIQIMFRLDQLSSGEGQAVYGVMTDAELLRLMFSSFYVKMYARMTDEQWAILQPAMTGDLARTWLPHWAALDVGYRNVVDHLEHVRPEAAAAIREAASSSLPMIEEAESIIAGSAP